MAIIFSETGQPIKSTNPFPVVIFDEDGNHGVVIKGSSAEVASSEVTVTATAQTVTRSAGADAIELYVLAGSINVRADGSAATATTGRPVGSGGFITLAVATASIVRAGDSDATVRVVNGTAA